MRRSCSCCTVEFAQGAAAFVAGEPRRVPSVGVLAPPASAPGSSSSRAWVDAVREWYRGWDAANLAASVAWCDYCESPDHDTADCPITDHDHYDRVVGR